MAQERQEELFGYKGFAVVDDTLGYIDHVRVKPANVSEVRSMEGVIIKGCLREDVFMETKGMRARTTESICRAKKSKMGLCTKRVGGMG